MRLRYAIVSLLFLTGALPGALPGQGAAIVRGPYIQRTSTDAAVLRWRTDVATDTWSGWGEVAGAFDSTVSASALVTEHVVNITGLSAKTIYYYAVGTTLAVLAGGDAEHRFRTAPPLGDPDPQRLWVIGDCGATSLPLCGGPASNNAALVRDGFTAWANGATPDLWLMLGDNAYCSGTDAEFQMAVFDVYPQELRTVAVWPVIGNHDAVSSDSATQTGPFFDMFSLPAASEAGGVGSGTEAYFSYDSGDVHVVQLDSADSDLTPGSLMLTWLVADLAADLHPWKIVAFHHPPYSRGTHDSDNPADSGGILKRMRENVVPIFEAHGVDLVLTGHSHGYERTFLIDGHYGTTDTFDPATMLIAGGDGDPGGDGAYVKTPGPHGGTVYVVSGTGSRFEGMITPWPALAVGLSELGSLTVDVTAGFLDVRMIRPDSSVADYFRIARLDVIFADGFETGSTAAWSN